MITENVLYNACIEYFFRFSQVLNEYNVNMKYDRCLNLIYTHLTTNESILKILNEVKCFMDDPEQLIISSIKHHQHHNHQLDEEICITDDDNDDESFYRSAEQI
jgi:hypothetical protein